MFSRALLLAAGVSVALSVAGCSSLTRPNEITVAAESTGDAKTRPPAAGVPAGQARPALPVRP